LPPKANQLINRRHESQLLHISNIFFHTPLFLQQSRKKLSILKGLVKPLNMFFFKKTFKNPIMGQGVLFSVLKQAVIDACHRN